ncbi:MAG: site-specific integrase [Chloroflexales bacterium]|nr:site-specific integrase [Chloroflexales bacterium]
MAQRRRGRGEGSIHERPDGRWCALLDLGIVNGKRKRKYIYGATRREVVEKLKAAQAAQATGANLAIERITVAQFLDRWIADVVSRRNKPRTVDGYKQIIKDHLKPHVGRHQLDKLRPEHVQAMLNTLAAEGRKYNTVRNVRATLRRALNQALRWQYVQRNVATLVDVPRYREDDDADDEGQPRGEFTIQPLDEEQARALLKAVEGHRLEALYRIALSLGLRRGEVLALRWTDINVDRATLRVTGLLQRLRGKLERGTTKTTSSARGIDLPPVLLAQLRTRRAAQEREKQEVGEAWQEHGLVFTTRLGTPIEPRNLIRHFKQVLKKAGLPETIRFHDLRHSCATLLIAQGVHPRVVMEILRHSQISTTMNTYAHVLPRLQRDATTKIEELIGGEATQGEGDGEATQSEAPGATEGGAEGDTGADAEANCEAPEDAEEGGDAGNGANGQPGDAADGRGTAS